MLELKHTDIGYRPDSLLIGDVVADLRPGELLALAGENGSGKSTLLRCCAGLFDSFAGNILIHGRDIRTFSRQELSQTVSLVTTANYFYESLSVEEVVSLGRHPYTNWWGSLDATDRKHVERAIEFVGLEAFSAIQLTRLSDGERQRAMIARALAQDTDLLLLDEPMAFLDQPNRASIADVLKRLRSAGKSLLYSTHEVDSMFRHADKCWLIHENRLIQGGPEDLALDGVFSTLYADRGLRFNEEELRFSPETSVETRTVLQIGDPRKALWTRRALDRLQREAAGNGRGGPGIIISDGEQDGRGWKVTTGQNTASFRTLYDLMAYLTGLK